MASGHSTQLTKQVGEYLVAAELCRRGFVAATFSGNVPHYDIVASDPVGTHIAVQVKAIRGAGWQLNMASFVKIEFDGDRQVVGDSLKEPYPNLVCVFVRLRDYGTDEFYIFTWRDLQAIVIEHHKRYLDQHQGVRPRNPRSTHVAVRPAQLSRFQNNWDLILQYPADERYGS